MPRQQFRVLYREFLFRMVDLEVLSVHAEGGLSKLFGQFAALLVFFSLLLALVALFYAGSHGNPVTDLIATMVAEHFLLATTMLVVGLFSVLSWESTFPNKRDLLVLTPLPVRARTMFAAKVAAVMTALALTIGLFHGFAGVLWPMAFAAHAKPVTVPVLTYDRLGRVSPADLQAVLTRDLAPQIGHGALSPGTGVGLTIGISTHGERHIFAYGNTSEDSLFALGPPSTFRKLTEFFGKARADRDGKAGRDLIQEQAGRLGLKDTAAELTPAQEARVARGPEEDFGADFLPYTGIYSSAGDLLTFLDADLRPDASGATGAGRADADCPGDICFQQGRTPGLRAFVLFNPKEDYSAVILLNHGSYSIHPLDLIGEHVRQRLDGAPAISLDSLMVPAATGFAGQLRWFGAYWFAMLAAGAFIYCAILGVQGFAAQLPRGVFLRVSGWLQMGAFGLLVLVYFLEPSFSDPGSFYAADTQRQIQWLPSYWFLGLFHQLNGTRYPALDPLARRAWIALAVAILSAAAAYTLCYLRTLRRIVEEPDIVPGAGLRWLPRFGSSLETAVVQFSIRTLLRSRQHRMILAFYLGIAFAITIYFLKAPSTQQPIILSADLWHSANAPLLASSLVILGFWIVGSRVICSMPFDLGANWIFRVLPIQCGAKPRKARRRALMALSLGPFLAVAAGFFFWLWPWRSAVSHLAVLLAGGLLLTELCLAGTHKLPFTCSYLPGKSSFHITFWICIEVAIVGIGKGAQVELAALGSVRSYAVLLSSVVAAAGLMRLFAAVETWTGEAQLQFEEAPEPVVFDLDLPRC